jgi:fructose/tagatose bisphosphate aldolase
MQTLRSNVRETVRAVEAVRSIAPSIVVEGEVGFIGSGSEIHDTAPDAARILTTTEEATRFVAATHVDVLAPAVGNMHGMLRQMVRGGGGETLRHRRDRGHQAGGARRRARPPAAVQRVLRRG